MSVLRHKVTTNTAIFEKDRESILMSEAKKKNSDGGDEAVNEDAELKCDASRRVSSDQERTPLPLYV